MKQSQVHSGFLAAFAEHDHGVHRLINHTDVRTLWQRFFNKLEKASGTIKLWQSTYVSLFCQLDKRWH